MSHTIFHWAVIGAGPAGIATVGKLIDHGVAPDTILWVDPEFKVGDFGTKWRKVSSNTKVKLFTRFYEACHSFLYASSPDHYDIKQADPTKTCLLSLAADPLQWITDHLKNTVQIHIGKVQKLKFFDNLWHMKLSNQTLLAKNVVLAIGAEPHSLSLPNVAEIPLEIALDPDQLAEACHSEEVVAVFGSSHSAIIVLKTLLEECQVKKVINFYLSPLRYAIYYDDWILFDNTGLKGIAAEWARKHLDGVLPNKLERVLSKEENLKTILPLCNKVIYATGFKTRNIHVEGINALDYDKNNGIIAPGLFGVGIGFPEAKHDRQGTLEHRVGLWKFMEYLDKIVPAWLGKE